MCDKPSVSEHVTGSNGFSSLMPIIGGVFGFVVLLLIIIIIIFIIVSVVRSYKRTGRSRLSIRVDDDEQIGLMSTDKDNDDDEQIRFSKSGTIRFQPLYSDDEEPQDEEKFDF